MFDEYELLKVTRPIFNNQITDEYDMPVMRKVMEENIDIENALPLNIQNLKKDSNNSNKILIPFNYDGRLLKYWNDPLRYIPLFKTVMAIGTPDYSVYKISSSNEIRHNIFMNRWLGCLWQEYGCIAIPTISWSDEHTYDICFSGVEPGGIVMISTLGTSGNQMGFLKGFNEMKKRIQPSLIIVVGSIVPGMTGRLVNYTYTDCFNKKKGKYYMEKLFDISLKFEIKEEK